MSRLAYTQRILEIVGNIRKQKEEITKVYHRGCGGLGNKGRHTQGAEMCSMATQASHPTLSERQSCLAISQHRAVLPSPLQLHPMQ